MRVPHGSLSVQLLREVLVTLTASVDVRRAAHRFRTGTA